MKRLRTIKSSDKCLLLIRELGAFLSSLIMPNLSIFIAWGLINLLANYVDGQLFLLLTGTEDILINYLLPLLIGYTGGKKFESTRGGAIAGIATIGVMVGTENSSVLGAMVIGPLAVIVFNQLNKLLLTKIKNGYEMLLQNVLAGIVGTFFCLVGLFILTPVINSLTTLAVTGVFWLITHSLLPLVNVIIEPLKVIFFNNAINHGVLTPIGMTMTKETGQSILFLLETNPGPGFGILMAYLLKGSQTSKNQAAGASMIQLIGGIHEVYFPFVLMEPSLFFVLIISGMSGTALFELFDVGLLNPVSPGSLLLILTSAASKSRIGILIGITVSALISFLLASLVLSRKKNEVQEKLPTKIKKEGKGLMIEKIVVACDAGIGSSAMGASLLEREIRDIGMNLPVSNTSIYQVENEEGTLVLLHPKLKQQLLKLAPKVEVLEIENFLDVTTNLASLQNFLAKELVPDLTEPKMDSQTKQLSIVLLFEKNRRGTQTMAIEMMRKQIEPSHLRVDFSKEAIETVKWDEENNYIVSKEFAESNQIITKQKNVLIMSDLFSMSEFEEWLKGVM